MSDAPRRARALRLALALGLLPLLPACVTVDEHGQPLEPDTPLEGGAHWRIEQSITSADRALADGAAAEIRGDWEAAHQAYTTVEGVDRQDARGALSLARTLHARGDAAGAARVLESELRLRTPSHELLQATADALLATGQPELALDTYERAASLAEPDAPLAAGSLSALILTGRFHAAMTVLDRRPPRELEAALWIPAGRVALVAGRPDYAIDVFSRHLAVHEQDHVAWLELARAHLLARDLEAARSAILRCLSIDPDHAQAFVLLGHVRYLTGELTRAQRCYETAIKNGASRAALGPILARLLARQEAGP